MPQTEDAVGELPPSAKLVFKVLEYNGALTQKGIVEKSRLSQRTVRDALDRLDEADVVEQNVYIQDARQSLYRLAPEFEADASDEATVAAER
jgi:transcription initiation factor IIE alpha subunit